jgi:hypothetical protein
MINRILLFLFLCCISSHSVFGQIKCPSTDTTLPLVCEIPVATRASANGTLGSPANAFNASFAAQLTQLPLPSATSGVIYVFNKKENEDKPVDNLGPILIDRPQTLGKNTLFIGFGFQQFNFNAINGTNLRAVPFLYKANSGNQDQYILQDENVSFKLNQYTVIATYGLNDSTDVSVIIPIERVSVGVAAGQVTEYSFDHTTQAFLGSLTTPTNPLSGVASGFGDVLLNVKHEFPSKGKPFHYSAGFLLRLPTGDALNYLGSGAYGFNPYGIASYQFQRFAVHARLGYIWNTDTVLIQQPDLNDPNCAVNTTTTGTCKYSEARLPGGLQYDMGADANIFQRVTLAGDLFGNQFQNSPALVPGLQSIPTGAVKPYTTVTAVSLPPLSSSYISNQFSIGLKWKPFQQNYLLVYANALFQLNNVGMRSDPVPLLGLSYTFKP